MSSEWGKKKLGDIFTLQRGHDLPSQERKVGQIPVMGSSGVTGYHDQYKAKGPGVIIGRSGNSMGQISYVSGNYWPLNTSLYITDFKGHSPEFLYYFLKQINFDQFNSGSAQKSLNRNAVYPFEVSFPSRYETQSAIASFLFSLENKIEVNQRVNQTLEQMAQALFKSWFVDFEPVKAKMAVLEAGGSREDSTLAAMTAISGKDVDALAVFEREHPEQYTELKATAELFPSAMQESELGEIPEGWSIGKFGDILEFNPKRLLKKGSIASYLDMKNVPVIGHSAQEIIEREFNSGSKFINGDTLLARITPCLENGKTAYVDFLPANEIVGWGSTEFIVMRSKKNLPLSLSYFFARLDSFRTIAIQSMQGTSGRQRADASVLEQHVWIVPPNEILQKFGAISDLILGGNRSRNIENKSLSQLRDTLLPKLLSGEITLPEAEQAVSEAENV
ncbi:restriction endonuclease subunit S [Pectobacterium brasiliense]|uniref:restriction endonuclease subunit S n=1 Tax=Pectobacterium brasiliense TaxID=180957 RepID=UPI002A7EEE3E|nr:restriction endonuclease subunit S [Pectobacterium brasiliense]MDY4350650.1 restriction endonuclease subunit S [Pectobacterium brasiliense]